jgi:HD-GYP domain-containing protein (c-di-GMP phosphodiesterase class II)
MYKPLSLDVIALNQPVPVNVWDSRGVLLLRKGEVVTSERHRNHLMLHSPMVASADWQAWTQGYRAELERRVREDEPLNRIASVNPHVEVRETRPAPLEGEVGPEMQWIDLHASLASLLLRAAELAHFPERLERVAVRARDLWRQRTDDSLLVLVQLLFDPQMGYSATHALLCAGLCDLVAGPVGLPEHEQATLLRAALTMNIGMTRAHDRLVRQAEELTDGQRQAVREHPHEGAELLRRAGIRDARWLELVEQHHEQPDGSGYPSGVRVQGLAQRLLQMADVYVACISPRRTRGGLLSQNVARELCFGPDHKPDPLGAMFVKSVGFYPPGSYVRLANEEVAMVARRGEKANAPGVYAIIGRQGLPLGEPVWRDTSYPAFEIKASLAPGDVRLVVNLSRLLGSPGF